MFNGTLPPPNVAIAGQAPPSQFYAEYLAAVDQWLRSGPGLGGGVADDTTAAGHALAAADFLAGVLIRSGPAGAFNDTTPTAAQIITAIPKCTVNTGKFLVIANFTAGAMTLSMGAGVTVVAGNTGIASVWVRLYHLLVTSPTRGGETCILRGLMTAQL